MKKHYEVVAAVIRLDQDVLCVKRGKQKSLPDKWEFPGGKIEAGETHEQAIIREIMEELKVLVQVDQYILSTDYEYPDFKVTLHFYYAFIVQGDIQLTEHQEYLWVKPGELDKLDFAEADISLIQELSKKQRSS